MSCIESKILIGLHRNINTIDKKTSKIASKYNLTFSQFMVLEVLYSKGIMTIGQVRDAILSSVGTIPIIINNLEKLNLIKRIQDPSDKRITKLELTNKGYEIINKIAPINEKMIKDSMQLLSNKEKEELLYLLKKIGGKLNES